MKLQAIASALVVSMTMLPAWSSDFVPSDVYDKAAWCVAAVEVFDDHEGWPGPGTEEEVSVAYAGHLLTIIAESDVVGLTEDEREDMRVSYADELAVQVPDYLATNDPAALRHELASCLELDILP